MTKKFDCGGYASKYNTKCADGRTIMPGAFKDMDGHTVPLVWQHLHNVPDNVLGHVLIQHRDDGPYVLASFNETEGGKKGKSLVAHGDIDSFSIYANDLVEKNKIVAHGVIREVSLVLSGANPGAKIDYIAIEHGDGEIVNSDDEAIIYSGLKLEILEEPKEEIKEEAKHAASEDKTIGEVFNTFTEEQKLVVYAIVGELVGDENLEQSNIQGDDETMKTNVFEKENNGKELKHSATLTPEQFKTIVADAQKLGSFKASFLAHAGDYGIDNIDVLFPDAQSVTTPPVFVTRDMAWVSDFLNGTRHTPFSRIKSSSADITVESARALGYVKEGLKKEEVFALLSRTTTPTTIYKKQKLDRDDIIDITDMDVVAWLKAEMRMMLDEEIARAGLVSDGRAVESDDKIPEDHIRPVYTDDEFYTHRIQVESDATVAEIEEAIIRGRVNYKGSGNPVMYTTTSFLTDLLLQKDGMERRLYATQNELAAALRVSKIVEVPVMDGLVYEDDGTNYGLKAIILNPRDYVYGADRGGAVSFFDDFDIDYNQYKYLLETRISGALVLPKSALVIEQEVEESV